MSSYAFRHARCSAFSVVGEFVPSRTFASRSVTTRSSSVIVSYGKVDGVSTTLPSGSRAEKFPAVPCTRFVRSDSLATQSSSSLISSLVPFSSPMSVQYLRVDAVHGLVAAQDAYDVVGDQLGMIRLGVVGRAGAVRRQDDVGS